MATSAQHAPHGCETLVVTSAAAGVHRPGKDGVPLASAAIAAALGHAGRYDLLTVAAPSDDPVQLSLLVDDIRTAVRLHGVKNVVAALPEGAPQLASDLRRALEMPALTIKDVDLSRIGQPDLPAADRLALVCMDWRQHGLDGGLYAALGRAFGSGSYGLLVSAGGAKELGDSSSKRGTFLVEALARSVQRSTPLSSIHLLTHMDCGMYGGDKGFPNAEAQVARLTQDLRASADTVKRATAALRWGVSVTGGIVALKSECVSEILYVSLD